MDLDQGGVGCPELGPDILGGGSVGPILRVRYVCDDAAHLEGVARIPLQGDTQANREANSEREGWSVYIPPAG